MTRNPELAEMVGDVVLDLGHLAERSGRTREALGPFEEAVRRMPDDPVAWYNLGDAYLGVGRPVDAEKALREALERAPGSRLIHYDLRLALAGQDGTTRRSTSTGRRWGLEACAEGSGSPEPLAEEGVPRVGREEGEVNATRALTAKGNQALRFRERFFRPGYSFTIRPSIQ